MKAKILAVILTTCVLFLNVFPPVVSASEPDIVVDSGELEIVVDSGELEIVVDSGELEIVVDSGEPELVPMAAAYCPGSSTNTSGSFSGYRYSYSSNAYIKYRLQHPDGRTIDIMSETNMSVALAREYMAVIEEMKNAEANVEAISDTLGIAIGIGRLMYGMGISVETFKNMAPGVLSRYAREFLKEQLGYDDWGLIEDILEAVFPDFCNVQVMMRNADNIYNDLWNMVSNNSTS